MTQNMLLPPTWHGRADRIPWKKFAWLRNLSNTTWCALNLTWFNHQDLPTGYNCYVISFYYEHIDEIWLQQQCERIQAPIILLTDWHYYDWPAPPNVHCYTYLSLGQQAQQIIEWWPTPVTKDIKYKASVFCNRVTQSKMLIFTKLVETMRLENLIPVLGTWVEDKNIHHWQESGNQVLDNLQQTFKKQYLGKEMRFDDFASKPNIQSTNSNPWTKAYQECALNFTNENFHYSYMQKHILPGPFISEKTLKCLIGGTAFVAVAQFDTYRVLENLGFKFDYGFDLSWDQDPGNLSRLESVVNLIDVLDGHTAQELYEMTLDSTRHNQDHVFSGAFAAQCDRYNQTVQQTIINQFI